MKILSIDFQHDFSAETGSEFKPRPCITFLKQFLFPYIHSKDILVAEIISDYRLPRLEDDYECCVPGSRGFESEVPFNIKVTPAWVKCMNSPEWTRDNAGDPKKVPGPPRPDPNAFTEWLNQTIGPPPSAVLLIGLTLDCCVLATAISLAHRGYKVHYLAEGVDTYSGRSEEKQNLFEGAALNWGKVVNWAAIQGITIQSSRR